MKVYVGQTRSRRLIRELAELGFGECTQRGETPPRRTPWFLDNGAFGDWKAGREFQVWDFCDAVEFVNRSRGRAPDFIVVPDRVAGGRDSVEFSMQWGPLLYGTAPLYVALQDGMTNEDLELFAGCYWVAGYFVGGTLEWKRSEGERLVEFAHGVGRPCHVGRVGTPSRVRWARIIGADSIDSCLPLWSAGNLDKFVREVQVPLFDFKKGDWHE